MDNNAGTVLFGLETEFGYSVIDDRGERVDPEVALDTFFQHCAKSLPHLRGVNSSARLYLTNGSLLYPDVGHPELATAESSSPTALLQSLRAGERIVTNIAQNLSAQVGIQVVNLYRTNVDYSAIGTTWGCHESYLSRRSPEEYCAQVLPHLVTRIIFSGCGGFDNRVRGADFVLSPRAFHLLVPTGGDRPGRRAIFSFRNEPLSHHRYHRVHLVCGESNSSELSTYLKVGTTALVLAMADAGVQFPLGRAGRWSAVRSIWAVSRDPACKHRFPWGSGESRTAIDVQRQYLELAEKHCDAPYMPSWAGDVCARWRSVLWALEEDPAALAGTLDWPTKLALFKQYTRAHSLLDWDSLPMWTEVASTASRTLIENEVPVRQLDSNLVKKALDSIGPAARVLKTLTHKLSRHGYGWDELDVFWTLRDELCELDMRYGQLYPHGIFLDLEAAGETRGRVLQPGQIEAAMERAPEAGRAQVRGDWIQRINNPDDEYRCSWTHIKGKGRFIDLGDPFVTEATWQPREARRRKDLPMFMRDHLARME